MSSARATTRAVLVPAAGTSSYMVTTGPGRIWSIWPRTPNSASTLSSRRAFWRRASSSNSAERGLGLASMASSGSWKPPSASKSKAFCCSRCSRAVDLARRPWAGRWPGGAARSWARRRRRPRPWEARRGLGRLGGLAGGGRFGLDLDDGPRPCAGRADGRPVRAVAPGARRRARAAASGRGARRRSPRDRCGARRSRSPGPRHAPIASSTAAIRWAPGRRAKPRIPASRFSRPSPQNPPRPRASGQAAG
jgi:hypothetical protein